MGDINTEVHGGSAWCESRGGTVRCVRCWVVLIVRLGGFPGDGVVAGMVISGVVVVGEFGFVLGLRLVRVSGGPSSLPWFEPGLIRA